MATRQWHDGHSSSVLCVGAAGGTEGLLASGSEGGEVTVWSQEGSILSRVTMPGGDDSTSVVFSPASPGLLYVSHGEAVSVLDPRNLKGVVKEFPDAGDEEINSMAINEDGSFLAAVDDSGAVRILDIAEGKVCRTLRRHTNICSSVAFRPKRPNNLVSAGLDMQVILWSQQKTRPLWTLNLQEVAEEEDGHEQKAGQLFNPPLAHCVSVASCGNIIACAAEDGRLHLMRVGSGSKLEQHGLFKAHSQGASQAHFLGFLSHPYWLATGGNDGQVALWDLSRSPVVAPDGNATSGAPVAHHKKVKGRAKAKQMSKGKTKALPPGQLTKEEEPQNEEAELGATGSTDQLSNTNQVSTSRPRLRFSHGDKVNWVCPALLKGEPSLVVADQSSSLTVYSLSGM
ncbi:hypothetical protein NHX12_009153 [Muraenolepis orangiensis]|uniref:Anaphase-promoting complex subunit 4-like WD40 domain-containing protein n=1 Tax=Muraenolepis orangiensis TaxID=630683 RepID=A0A9Q0IBX3_9TELE|nr:hypothetical protein NHX12_009153 [Muraenolepis orangiensis]